MTDRWWQIEQFKLRTTAHSTVASKQNKKKKKMAGAFRSAPTGVHFRKSRRKIVNYNTEHISVFISSL